MSTNIFVNGVDLDALLLPRGAHAAIGNTGIQSNGGVDLAQRFAGAAFGTPFGTTNIFSSQSTVRTDIGQLFAALGTGGTTISLTAGTVVPGMFQTFFGFGPSGIGAVSPTTIRGYTIVTLVSFQDTFNMVYQDQFAVAAAVDPGSTLFSTLVVGAITRNFSAATYNYTGGNATWTWAEGPTTTLFQHTGSFTVVIT